VCLFDGYECEPYRNGKTDADAVWGGAGETRVGPNNNALDGVHNGATYRIRLSDSCAVAMLPCLKLFWPLVSTAIILYLYAHQQEALWPLCC